MSISQLGAIGLVNLAASTVVWAQAAPCIDFTGFDSSYTPTTTSAPESGDPNSYPANWSFEVENRFGTAYYEYLPEPQTPPTPTPPRFLFFAVTSVFTNTSAVIYGQLNLELIHFGTADFHYEIWDMTNTSVIASGTWTPSSFVPTGTSYSANITFTPPTYTIAPGHEVPLPV